MRMWSESAPRQSWARRLAGLAVSAALHGLLFFVVITGRLPQLPERRITLIPIPVPQDEHAEEMPTYRPERRREPAGPVRRVPPAPFLVPTVIDTSRPLPLVVTRPVDTFAPARRARAGRIGPAPGDGRLWVRVLPLPPKDLAARLAPSHVELVDSAVTAIVQGYLDSIAREPGADRVPLPDWTTEIDGKKFGLDSRNIYVAGLKIPAVVLALLPLPSGGNQLSALDHNGQWIAEDLRRAASRAATLEDFKRAVRELRQEKQRQKDLERAQRERPDSTPSQD